MAKKAPKTSASDETPQPLELADLLNRIGWTTGHLARRLSVSPATAADWVTGRRGMPPAVLPWLRAISAALDTIGGAPAGWVGGRRSGRPINRDPPEQPAR
jgi:DNA-binding transcriptional regulator YiaG